MFFCLLCFLYFGLHPFGQPIKHPTLPPSLLKKFPGKKPSSLRGVTPASVAVHTPFMLHPSSPSGQPASWPPSRGIASDSWI